LTRRTLIRGGCVLTLGTKTRNFTDADVLIEDDRISEVGQALRAKDAEVVDATDTVVMPGFVDTHRHAWRSLFRNLERDPSAEGAAPEDLGERYGSDDVYAATLVGLLGAVEAGITTVVDWCELTLDEQATDAALQAHEDAGLRTVFVRATASGDHRQGNEDSAPRRRAETARPLTTMAMGSELHTTEPDRMVHARAAAREAGSRWHVHAGSAPSGAIADLAGRGLLDGDVTLVHGSAMDGRDVEAMAGSGAFFSLTPSSDMAGGFGSPPIQELIDRDVRPGLGVDDERAAPGDLFAQMRATISLQHATVFDRKLAGKAGLPRLMSTRDVIRFATIDGAAAAGLHKVTGSLEPGKQADVLVLWTDRPNIYPINDPIGAVVWGMDTSNVGWVFAAGRALVRDGVLEADVERARVLATAARERVAPTGGLVARATAGGEG
jgi:cytosine/adenosine deaminase-related metal-dependent hydrolase